MDDNEKVKEFNALDISTVMREIDVLTELSLKRKLSYEELTDEEVSRFSQLIVLVKQMENPSRNSMSGLVRMLLRSTIDGKALASEAVQYVLERLNAACNEVNDKHHKKVDKRNARIVRELHLTRPDKNQTHQTIVKLICRASFLYMHAGGDPVEIAIMKLDEYGKLGESVDYAKKHFKKYSESIWFDLALRAKWGSPEQIYYRNRLSPKSREEFNNIPKPLMLKYQWTLRGV